MTRRRAIAALLVLVTIVTVLRVRACYLHTPLDVLVGGDIQRALKDTTHD